MSHPKPLHALAAAALAAAVALGPAHLAAAATPGQPAQGLPTSEQLTAALLTVDDVGPGFTQVPSTASPSPSAGPSTMPSPANGCDALSDLINMHTGVPGPETPHAEAELDGPGGNPMVTESLTAEDAGKLTTDLDAVTAALKSCHTITFNAGANDSVTFTVTPVTLGDRQDAPAVRLDGTLAGVQLNAFVGVERFGTVGMAFGFFQRGGDSPQLASFQYRAAVAKVQRALGTTAGSTTPPTATAPVTQGTSV
ncbi:hypothetical protein [Kitasatospora sp. NPDC087271]|uniref:hypothetical protein n=1 Tax=Kitasatospora sp. NPDC087271 TaxID=3364067 RepID=UPI0037FC877F